MKKIAIIGAGAWGQALFHALSKDNSCVITSRGKKDIDGFVDVKDALKCEYLVFALPTQVVSQWLDENFVNHNQKILIASKGIENSSRRFLNEIFLNHVCAENISYLSGPSFAKEVRESLPCALVISSINAINARAFASFFPSYIKAYISDDIIGAEICGAYKNVLAIASGICEGLKLGNNARASLIARGLVEMHRFGKSFGAKDETFMGLSGAGDLFLTASSTLSRNFRVGLALGQGKTLPQILEELKEVAEGVYTAKALFDLAKERDIYIPIAREVYYILEGKSVKISLQDLLSQ